MPYKYAHFADQDPEARGQRSLGSPIHIVSNGESQGLRLTSFGRQSQILNLALK